MNRPTLEVADIVRAAGNSFWEKHKSHLAWLHRKVLDAILRCRTAALGGHLDKCVNCGHQAISYNSCRSRNCPRCQGNARARWLAARSAELLPVPYFHIVFTLPHEFSALILQNKRLLYDLLFRTSAASLLEVARDPEYFGAEIGFLNRRAVRVEFNAHVGCDVLHLYASQNPVPEELALPVGDAIHAPLSISSGLSSSVSLRSRVILLVRMILLFSHRLEAL